jgi:NAD-dependent dihydropyrimidine dehydrogenase PreA subunit
LVLSGMSPVGRKRACPGIGKRRRKYLILVCIHRFGKDGVAMAVIINEDDCTACGACSEVCPVGAITVEDVAHVDSDECVECGACVDECPNGAISLP